ncbi:MAG TPA: VWA domain-containing protein [Candidatus Aquilonibacter sp.]|nr:VWA domain-containing protein [Candidatus Aquilonibacter sp.]
MTFDRPIFFLLLLALPVLWIWARKKRGKSRASFALKAAVCALLVAALAGPRSQLPFHHVSIAVLADTSASMPRESIADAQALLRNLDRANSNADLRLITFAGDAQLRAVPNDPQKVAIPENAVPAAGMETDIEGAMDLALSTFPNQGARRILLVSDGNQTRGDALAAALRARADGVAVFTEPSGGISRLPVQLAGISAPEDVFSGERFTVSLELESAQPLAGQLVIDSGSREIAEKPVQLQTGSNAVEVDARIVEAGVNSLDVNLNAQGYSQPLFSQAVTVRKPRVLYISGQDGPSGPLLKTLDEADIDVQRAGSFPIDPEGANWDAVILDDYPDQPLPPPEGQALASYVSAGGGLIFIGGDRNAQIAKEPQTAFDELLPVRGDPNPAPQQPTALMLVLDKSLSMEGPKIAMVRQAARASIAGLRPIDMVGLIAFDKEYRWVLPLGPVSQATGIDAAIESIEASGGTRIYPAMQAAYDAILPVQATRKHIILLTDGMSPPGDLPQLERDAAMNRITISTIGVGDDVDSKFLQDIADATHGKSYFIEDPHRITQIVNDETKNLENTEIVEKPVHAVPVRPVELTDGIDFANSPALLGFVKTKARPGAETILRASTGEPLLVRWQYGLGRVVTFLSDSRARWSAGWVRWRSYGTFWPQMVRDMSRRDAVVRTGVHFNEDGSQTTITYDVSEGPDNSAAAILQSLQPLSIAVTAPDGSSAKVPLRKTAPDHYEATLAADQSGLYRVAADGPAGLLPPVGFVRTPEELKSQAVNMSLLQEMARVTGGAVDPSIAQLLDDRGAEGSQDEPLWPYLLVLALLLNLFELAWRKGHFEPLISRAPRCSRICPRPRARPNLALLRRVP